MTLLMTGIWSWKAQTAYIPGTLEKNTEIRLLLVTGNFPDFRKKG